VDKKSLVSIAALGATFGAIDRGIAVASSEPPDAAPAGVALDASFGSDGVLDPTINDAGHDRYISVAFGADGSVFASGFTEAEAGDHAFLVSKFTPEGVPDETFGDGGSAVVNVVAGGGDAEVARGLVVGDDGSVVLAGPAEHDITAAEPDSDDDDAAVVRLDPAGALDETFGDGGVAIIDLGAGKAVDAETYLADAAWGLAAREGGYVLFASTPNQAADRADSDFAIVGLTDAGAIDEAFGDAGTVIVDVDAAADNARRVKVDADGRILAAGYSRDGDGIVSPTLIRLLPDGTLDDTFGDAGVANHVVLDSVTEAYNVAFQGDDYILSGYGRNADSETVDQVTFRFTADGAWDESFGDGGVTAINLADQDDRGRDVTVLPDGSIIVVGSAKLDDTNLDALIVHLDANGVPDATFGEGGALRLDLGGVGDAFFGVGVTADGSAVCAAGFFGAEPDTDGRDNAVLARLTIS